MVATTESRSNYRIKLLLICGGETKIIAFSQLWFFYENIAFFQKYQGSPHTHLDHQHGHHRHPIGQMSDGGQKSFPVSLRPYHLYGPEMLTFLQGCTEDHFKTVRVRGPQEPVPQTHPI